LPELATRLQELAIERRVTVGTAESCTGGLVGHAITANPGSSDYYRGGVISYADEVKSSLLDVPPEAIERHGAVSAQVAVAMAEGARRRVGCDYGVAVTGVAGPDGGSAAKPVGLTYVAAAGPDGDQVRRFVWDGDRAANKERSAAAALRLLIETIGGTDPESP
jgi:PncC family amidohydrolase